ncbi:MAG: glycosyltransferase [Lachnospiraceae bacterium]|nr:glycosyltransferase [Lachnospiraceae bacterium]
MIVNKPLISVIVSVFNIEKYISKCIESITEQTYKNIQIILVDDGSTDTSGEICDKYAEKDARIQVIHKENEGPTSARNAGLAAANGNYVGFVDGDDYIDTEYYEVLLQDMMKNDVDFVHMGFMEEWENTGTIYGSFETAKYELSRESKRYFIEGILGKSDVIHITPSIWSKLFKREFIRKCHAKVPSELSYGEDLLCLSVCLLEGNSVCLNKSAMYHYVRRQGSLTDTTCVSAIIKISERYHALKNLFIQYGEYEGLRFYLETDTARSVMRAIKKIGRCVEDISFYYLRDTATIKGKRVVIYGAGSVGQGYYAQISRYSSCTIVGWVDLKYQRYHFDYAEVQPVTQLDEWQYDIILVAIKDEDKAKQIKFELMEQRGIPDKMILWERPGSIFDEMN